MNDTDALRLVEELLISKPLSKAQIVVFSQSWQELSYLEIANAFDYDYGYIKDAGAELWQRLSAALGQKITKQNFRIVLANYVKKEQKSLKTSVISVAKNTELKQDWGDAIDTSIFYGRSQEIQQLKTLIVDQQCRLITILGIGGVGKTALSITVAESVQEQFEYLFWWSLRDAPPLQNFLTRLIQFLSDRQVTPLPDSDRGKLSRLMELMQQKRCLVILDNFEGILLSQYQVGDYRESYAEYGELLRRVGEINHRSCILMTSREKPAEVGCLEGPCFPVRTLKLDGLDGEAGRSLLLAKGLECLPEQADRLVKRYHGNPLALKIAASSIQDLFQGNIEDFLRQDLTLFNGIVQLVSQQVQRLTDLEKQAMFWLAVNREPITLAELHRSIVPIVFKAPLAEILESLRRRSLVECGLQGFTLQAVVMEFMSSQLIEQTAQEIVLREPKQLDQVALLQAIAKDYVRATQERVILEPLVQRLLGHLGTSNAIAAHLYALLHPLRDRNKALFGYTCGNLLNLWRHLQADLTGYDFSNLNIRQAYLQDLNLHHVDFSEAEFSQCIFAETFGGITAVSLSQNGQWIASSDSNGDIQIWNLQSSQRVNQCKGHNGWVWGVRFSPDHRLLASCGQDQTVRLWDAQTGVCLKVLSEHASIVTSVAFSPSGQTLASSSYDQTIKLWDVNTGHCIETLRGHESCVWSVCFTADGQFVVSASEDQTLKIWDVREGADPNQNCRTIAAHQAWIKSVAVSAQGTLIASASFDQTVKIWDFETGICLKTLQGHIAPVVGVAISPDAQTIASASYDQTVKLWDAQTGNCLKTLEKHTNRVWTVDFHPDGHLLASGGEDNRGILWDVVTGQTIKTWQGHSNLIYAIALNAQSSFLASAHEDQTIKLWNLDRCIVANSDCSTLTVKKPDQTLRGHTGRVLSVAFHPQGTILASGGTDRTIRLWDVTTGHCLQTLYGHNSWVWAVAFSADGNWLGSASYDHSVRIWNPKTGDCVRVLEGHTSSVLAIAFHPTLKVLASCGYEKAIKIWDIETGECLKAWQGHHDRVWSVTFIPGKTPNTSTVVTGGDDNAIHVWNLQTGKCLKTLKGHSQAILSLNHRSENNTLISTSIDKTIKIWDVETGDCLQTFEGHYNWVWGSAIAPDRNLLFSGSQDETIKWWDLESEQCLGTLRSHRPYEGMKITKARGFNEAQHKTLLALGAVDENR